MRLLSATDVSDTTQADIKQNDKDEKERRKQLKEAARIDLQLKSFADLQEMGERVRRQQSTDQTEQEKAQNDVLFALLQFPEYHQHLTPEQIEQHSSNSHVAREADGGHQRECQLRDFDRLRTAPLPEKSPMDAKFLNDLRALVKLVG